MTRILLISALVLCSSATLAAQDYPEQNVSVNAGGAFPTGKFLRGVSNRPLVGIAYGYRWNRYAQFDLGFDTVFTTFTKDIGNSPHLPGGLDISDHLFLVPLGVRGILPIHDDRFQAFAGGGGVYMRYQISPGDQLRGSCGLCYSRDLGGYYVQAGGNAALDYRRRFRAGGSAHYYAGYGTVQGGHTVDRWWSITGDFTYTFGK